MEFTKSHWPEEAIRDSYDKCVADFNHTEQHESGHVDTILFGGGAMGGGGGAYRLFDLPTIPISSTNFQTISNPFRPTRSVKVRGRGTPVLHNSFSFLEQQHSVKQTYESSVYVTSWIDMGMIGPRETVRVI